MQVHLAAMVTTVMTMVTLLVVTWTGFKRGVAGLQVHLLMSPDPPC